MSDSVTESQSSRIVLVRGILIGSKYALDNVCSKCSRRAATPRGMNTFQTTLNTEPSTVRTCRFFSYACEAEPSTRAHYNIFQTRRAQAHSWICVRDHLAPPVRASKLRYQKRVASFSCEFIFKFIFKK